MKLPQGSGERDTSNRKTIVMAHRGGNFGPSNSLKNYKGAIDAKVEGIEFDVSNFLSSRDYFVTDVLGLAFKGWHSRGYSWWTKC